MKDIESYVFNQIKTAAVAEFTNLTVQAEYSPEQDNLPCLTVEMRDNTVYTPYTTGDKIENAAEVMFEVNVYTNTGSHRKLDAKDILYCVDDKFAELGFTRAFYQPVQNLLDSTVYRLVARYTAVVADITEDESETEDYVVFTG